MGIGPKGFGRCGARYLDGFDSNNTSCPKIRYQCNCWAERFDGLLGVLIGIIDKTVVTYQRIIERKGSMKEKLTEGLENRII
jgi:hypothetical protein